MVKYEENKKVKKSQEITPDGVRLYMLTPSPYTGMMVDFTSDTPETIVRLTPNGVRCSKIKAVPLWLYKRRPRTPIK